MGWPAHPFCILSQRNINQKITVPEGSCLGTGCSVQMGWEHRRKERKNQRAPSPGKSQDLVRSPQVVWMERTQSNTSLKPLRAQWCISVILLSYSNFHCLLKGRKKKGVLCFYLESRAHHFPNSLCWFCLMKQFRYHVTGIAGVGGNKTSLQSRRDAHMGSEDLWLALENNGWCSLWILQENLTEKRHVSFMPLPSVTGSPANDLEQVGIPISKGCAL